MKNSDLSDVSVKPQKAEKEKKNALADIDMNNYAGMCNETSAAVECSVTSGTGKCTDISCS